MRVTSSLLSRGFLARSLDELTRLTRIAITAEGTRVPTAPYLLKTFHDSDSVKDCKTMSDADIGGFSQANLDWVPPATSFNSSNPYGHVPPTASSNPADPNARVPPVTSSNSSNPNGHVRFHGHISIDLPPDMPEIQRTGYAAWRTLDRQPTIFGKSLWDIDPYAYLALRIKSDGRRYFVNLQTETIVPTDLHQHRLYARKPGEWETVLIDWNDFVRTNHGVVVEPQSEMLRQSLRTVGIGVIDRIPGKFELFIEKIWATNGLTGQDLGEGGKGLAGGESDPQHREKMRWGALRKSAPPT